MNFIVHLHIDKESKESQVVVILKETQLRFPFLISDYSVYISPPGDHQMLLLDMNRRGEKKWRD